MEKIRTIGHITYRKGERLVHRQDGPKNDVERMAQLYMRDATFYRWVGTTGTIVRNEVEVIAFIQHRAGIVHLDELTKDPVARLRFIKLVREPYLAWKEQQA